LQAARVIRETLGVFQVVVVVVPQVQVLRHQQTQAAMVVQV
jgi:hypothetical protein